MSEANKALLQRHFNEVLNQGNLGVIDEIYSDRYVLDAPVQTEGSAQAHGQTMGREGLKKRVTLFRTAFPDIHFTIDNILAENAQVAVQYTFRGTHTGQFRELKPTGAKIVVTGILIALVVDGKIDSAFSVFDSGEMMHQIMPHTESSLHHLFTHLREFVHGSVDESSHA